MPRSDTAHIVVEPGLPLRAQATHLPPSARSCRCVSFAGPRWVAQPLAGERRM